MRRVYLHTLPIRIWHWANALLIIMLCITGIQLRMPEAEIFSHYRTAVILHKYFGFLLAGSFLFWLLYYLISGTLIKYYLIRPNDLRGMVSQALYYAYGVFTGAKNPFTPSADAKFNGLQKMAYTSVMLLFTPAVIFTGILFSDVLYFLGWIRSIGGLRVLDAFHVIFGYLIGLYFLVHLYMATLGPSVFTHTKAMITGYEEEHEETEQRD